MISDMMETASAFGSPEEGIRPTGSRHAPADPRERQHGGKIGNLFACWIAPRASKGAESPMPVR